MKRQKPRTYSIYFRTKDVGRDLNMEDVLKSDTLNAGMLEAVLEDLLCWHEIEAKDLDRVMTYIMYEFGHILICIEEEHYSKYICNCKLICGVQL